MSQEIGIDLENIVYYRGDTHYFVMTALKNCLLKRGVIKEDIDDRDRLLAPSNIGDYFISNFFFLYMSKSLVKKTIHDNNLWSRMSFGL